MALARERGCVDGDDGARGFAHLAGRGPRARARSSRSARPRRCGWTLVVSIHRWRPPWCAPPPRRRPTATQRSAGAFLLSRSCPLHPAGGALETGPGVVVQTHAPAPIGSRSDSPPGAANAVAPPSRERTEPLRPRNRRRTPSLPRTPRTDRTARPPPPLLTEGWTPDAFDGTVTHGGRVLRCARHEGSGLITRAFTFSDVRVLRHRRPSGDDDVDRSRPGTFVTFTRTLAGADTHLSRYLRELRARD
jgi:hypothetical protein